MVLKMARREQLDNFSQGLVIAAIDQRVAIGQLRSYLKSQGTPIGNNDLIIAAHALSLQATLVTNDRDFSKVPNLKIENWLHG